MAAADLDPSVLAGLRARLSGAVVDQLVVVFGDSVNDRRAALAEALASGDGPAAARACHSIRGSAQLVGARRLEAIAAKWEERARQGESALTDQALAEVTDALRGVQEALALQLPRDEPG